MLVANTTPPPAVTPVHREVHAKWSRVSEVLLWIVGIVLAFILPLVLVVAAVLVSSYGIPLPFEVRVP